MSPEAVATRTRKFTGAGHPEALGAYPLPPHAQDTAFGALRSNVYPVGFWFALGQSLFFTYPFLPFKIGMFALSLSYLYLRGM